MYVHIYMEVLLHARTYVRGISSGTHKAASRRNPVAAESILYFRTLLLEDSFNSIFLTVLRFQILWLGSPYVLQDSPVLSSLNLNTVPYLVNKCCRFFLYPLLQIPAQQLIGFKI